MTTKPFKTIPELIEIMESRGIHTDDETPFILMSESYYAVINGYKTPFLDRSAMQSSSSDVFLPSTSFSDIYNLFCFDRELRQITFGALVKAEAILKTATVYAFSNANREQDFYLESSNYAKANDMLVPNSYRGDKTAKARLYQKNIRRLLGVLNNKLSDTSERPFIRHYLRNHGHVPLWVLSNDLTFGNMAHMFQLLPRRIQVEVCKTVSAIHAHEGVSIRFNPEDILAAYSALVGFRNICAHDERLYCATIGQSNQYNYQSMYEKLKAMLPPAAFRHYIEEMARLLRAYSGKFGIANSTGIFSSLGFPGHE